MTKNEKRFSAPRAGYVIAVLSSTLLALGCSRPAQPTGDLATKATDVVGCEGFESDFYDGLYQFPIQKTALPSQIEMHNAFIQSVTHGRLGQLSAADQQRVADELANLYKLLALDSLQVLGAENSSHETKLATLTALEIGDSTTPEREALQAQIQAEFSKIAKLMQSTNAPACAKAPQAESPTLADIEPASGTLFSGWKSSQPRVIYGALKTMATAYQSCDIANAPVVDKSTPDVLGIKDLGFGSDGIGHRRLVSSAADVMRTNPYLENYRQPSASCFDVTKTPLIYDYGGRPVTSAGTFDMFKNAGSGTAALGTDCSGYVFMALATAGLRTAKGKAIKPGTILGTTSTLFTNPQKNGLTCFDFIKFSSTNSLRAGDVVAKAGHVLMIKSVGADPFGIDGITNVADCTLANMDVSRFDFTIIQDSSVKNGIGMHIHKAADYLQIPDSLPMANGLLGHAVNACKAKFGQTNVARNSHVSIVRHSGSRDCVQTSEIRLEHQSCVASCPLAAPLTTASNP